MVCLRHVRRSRTIRARTRAVRRDSAGGRDLGHLNYANVIATVALFVSLGGASYAVVALPPHSVGSRQLRAKAVTLGAMAFPLGVTGYTEEARSDLPRRACNGIEEGAAVSCLGEPEAPDVQPIRTFTLTSSGSVFLSAVVELENQGAPGTSVIVTGGLSTDGKPPSEDAVTIEGGQRAQLSVQRVVDLDAGRHILEFGMAPQYYDAGKAGDVVASRISVIGIELPRAD